MSAAEDAGTTGFENNLMDTFHAKYDEFAADLLGTFPEFSAQIQGALAIPKEERPAAYREAVFATTKSVSRSTLDKTPGTVLPGVVIPNEIWETLGKKTKSAIFEYLSLMNLCVAFQAGDAAGADFTKEWAESMMREARASMNKIDFESLSQNFFKAFGSKDGALPPLPEKFLKGKLAKLAEDMVKEFNPDDFGLKAEDIEACERDPTRAFEILMKSSLTNPAVIQKAMTRIGKRLQDKVARGELRPQELVAEAEELIKEFQTHPAFVDLMESFRGAFSAEDEDVAKATGQDSRLAQVKARLRKKMEAKKAGKK